jgi:hypothetical protein
MEEISGFSSHLAGIGCPHSFSLWDLQHTQYRSPLIHKEFQTPLFSAIAAYLPFHQQVLEILYNCMTAIWKSLFASGMTIA